MFAKIDSDDVLKSNIFSGNGWPLVSGMKTLNKIPETSDKAAKTAKGAGFQTCP